MKANNNKQPSQAQIFKLLNPPQEPDATIGACAFVQLLNDLDKRYVAPLQKEFDRYFIKRRPREIDLGFGAITGLSPYTFTDGVKVKSMDYLWRVITWKYRFLAGVWVMLKPETQRVHVTVYDYRFTPGLTGSKRAQRFSQELEVPHEFYQFLSDKCLEVGYAYHLIYITKLLNEQLAKSDQKLHEFDRARKLRALIGPGFTRNAVFYVPWGMEIKSD